MKTRYFVPVLVLSLLISAMPAYAADSTSSTTISLPAPKTDGKVSVEKALKERRSVRNPATTPLSLEEIGQLCWAAQGVTDDKGHRTAPSAMALYPLELYVIAGAVTDLASGFYHYEPATHSLKLIAAGDKRADFVAKGVGQEWITKAPAIFVISGVAEKMARMKGAC
jgi:nitroreductase